MTAFKRSQAKYVKKSYETTNWPEYETGLQQPGSLTVWISGDEIKGWPPPSVTRQARCALCGSEFRLHQPVHSRNVVTLDVEPRSDLGEVQDDASWRLIVHMRHLEHGATRAGRTAPAVGSPEATRTQAARRA